jgi:hypothetical protein
MPRKMVDKENIDNFENTMKIEDIDLIIENYDKIIRDAEKKL